MNFDKVSKSEKRKKMGGGGGGGGGGGIFGSAAEVGPTENMSRYSLYIII